MKNNSIITKSIFIGVFLWYVAAFVVNQFGMIVFNSNNSAMILMMLSSIPSTLLFLWIIKYIVKQPFNKLFETVVVLTTTATLLDGLAMTYLRGIFYDTDYAISLHGSSWILWGVGMGLLASYMVLPKSEKLSLKHILLAIALGIAFWFNGAVVINQIGEQLLTDRNTFLFLGLLIAIPVTIITVIIAKYLFGLAYDQMLKPISIMTFTATFCDTIALTWFQSLYSTSTDIAFHGAALILWGAGLGLLIAYYLEKREKVHI